MPSIVDLEATLDAFQSALTGWKDVVLSAGVIAHFCGGQEVALEGDALLFPGFRTKCGCGRFFSLCASNLTRLYATLVGLLCTKVSDLASMNLTLDD